MRFKPLAIADVVLITPTVFTDARGFFMESFRQDVFTKHCGDYQFVQDNHSLSVQNTLRGLHYQHQQPQGKLVRVSHGKIFDVAVDLRKNSATFGQWVGAVLSASNKQMLWVPPGFAHGFYVLSPQAECFYKCTAYYSPEDEYTLKWNDASVAVPWPLIEHRQPQLSAKDEQGLVLADCPTF